MHTILRPGKYRYLLLSTKLIGSSYDKYPYTVTASVVFVGLVYSLKVLTVDTLQSTDGILFVFFFS